MVKAVLETIDRLQITRAIGIGVGLGAAILLRAAEKRPRVFGGLILISPVFHAAAAWERVTTSAEGFFSNTMGLGLSHHVKEKFLHRWLSNAAREENHSVAQVLEDALDKLNAKNVTRFVVAGTYRSGCQEIVKGIKGKVLLITGKESNLRYHTDDVFADFDPAMTSWLDLQECGSLPHEEHPDSVAEAISLFLQGFSGYA